MGRAVARVREPQHHGRPQQSRGGTCSGPPQGWGYRAPVLGVGEEHRMGDRNLTASPDTGSSQRISLTCLPVSSWDSCGAPGE